eukprot:scaffold4495_cov79-Skeletonema_marinoi.AAC.1
MNVRFRPSRETVIFVLSTAVSQKLLQELCKRYIHILSYTIILPPIARLNAVHNNFSKRTKLTTYFEIVVLTEHEDGALLTDNEI